MSEFGTSPLLTDLYQLTMLQSYWQHRMQGTAVFELFVRKLTAEGYAPTFTPVSQINPAHPHFVGSAKPSAGASG